MTGEYIGIVYVSTVYVGTVYVSTVHVSTVYTSAYISYLVGCLLRQRLVLECIHLAYSV
jgi:hypothetical protein